MSARYERTLDGHRRVKLKVQFVTVGPEVINYSLVLLAGGHDEFVTVRVYDGAHGVNEMHRYTRSTGKQPAIRFHHGTLGEGMRAAIGEMKQRYPQMIEGWER